MNLFQDTPVVLGVTGSIAAYKAATLASRLYQLGAQVDVALTDAAAQFITPLTFSALTHRPIARSVLTLGPDSEIEHVSFARRAKLMVVAPTTANTLARLAHGMADDIVSAIALDTRAPILLAPAMETGMWENPATRANVEILKARGMTILEPNTGHLASGAQGTGRMAEPEDILGAMRLLLAWNGALKGCHIVVTAGGTREPIDPVRVIANHSSGKMGYALAEAALERGARVTLITSVNDLENPYGAKIVNVTTTRDLKEAVLATLPDTDALIMAAAPADFYPADSADHKLKKEELPELTLRLARNPDILGAVAEQRASAPQKTPRVVVGFAAETENLLANGRTKRERKNLDLLVANPVPQTFGSDLVQAVLIARDDTDTSLPPMPKSGLADLILERVQALLLA